MTDALVRGIDFSAWAKRHVNGTLGFSLLTDTYDPAHLLHQFVKKSTGFTGDETQLARRIVAGQGRRGRPLPNADLRALAEALNFALPESESALDDMRHDLSRTLASDKVVYESQGSFQIASSLFTGRNQSAADLGSLLFALVARDAGGIELLDRARNRLAEPQSNGFWAVEDFLRLRTSEDAMRNLESLDVPTTPSWLEKGRGKELGCVIAHLLKQCLRGIAYGSDSLYAIRALALGLTWSSALLAIHAPSIISHDRLLTLLVEVKPSKGLSTVKTFATEESYGGISRSYDLWIQSCLIQQVRDDWEGIPFSRDGVIEYLRDTKACRRPSERPTTAARESAMKDAALLWDSTPDISTESSREFAESEIARMLRGILRAGLQPEAWYSRQARYSGFLYPRRQGHKRLTFEPALLPLLVLGLFDESQRTLELSELLSRANESMGLVVGPNEADNLVSPGPALPELEMNLVSLIESLVQLGLAKSYGDSVTEVLYPTQLLGQGR